MPKLVDTKLVDIKLFTKPSLVEPSFVGLECEHANICIIETARNTLTTLRLYVSDVKNNYFHDSSPDFALLRAPYFTVIFHSIKSGFAFGHFLWLF